MAQKAPKHSCHSGKQADGDSHQLRRYERCVRGNTRVNVFTAQMILSAARIRSGEDQPLQLVVHSAFRRVCALFVLLIAVGCPDYQQSTGGIRRLRMSGSVCVGQRRFRLVHAAANLTHARAYDSVTQTHVCP